MFKLSNAIDTGALRAGHSTPTHDGSQKTALQLQTQNPVSGNEQFARDSFEVMKKWDTNKDGFLTPREIDRAMLDPSHSTWEAATICALKRERSFISRLKNDEWGFESSISSADLKAFASLPAGNQQANKTTFIQGRTASKLYNGASKTLYGGHPVRGTDLVQGHIGDCYLMAALSSKLYQNPQFLQSMISELPNKRYSIQFPCGDQVNVSAPTAAEQVYFSHSFGLSRGFWPTLMEKGYGELRNQQSLWSTTTVPSEAADGGAPLEAGIAVFSAHGYESDYVLLSSGQTLRNRLTESFAQKKAVTAGVFSNPFTSKALTDNNIVRGHAYGVLDYDPLNDIILLFNPWHRKEPQGTKYSANDKRNDGIFRLTLGEFKENFDTICYER